jgi:hypothetical protein
MSGLLVYGIGHLCRLGGTTTSSPFSSGSTLSLWARPCSIPTTNALTNRTTLCQYEFTSRGGDRELAADIMHELSHQVAPFSTLDTQTYFGFAQPTGRCSASEAEDVARAIWDNGCSSCPISSSNSCSSERK